MARLLTDEHIPGPFITVLRSLGFDVRRAKDAIEEGAEDGRLIEYANDTGRVVVTCDRRFTLVDGVVTDEHPGVIYAEQPVLQVRPEDAAFGVDRIRSTVGLDAMQGGEFYLGVWM